MYTYTMNAGRLDAQTWDCSADYPNRDAALIAAANACAAGYDRVEVRCRTLWLTPSGSSTRPYNFVDAWDSVEDYPPHKLFFRDYLSRGIANFPLA